MATVVTTSAPLTVDPLKHSQALGGILAMLGMANCMPLIHGTQGCSAFAKSLLTRHFREPIPIQSTAVTEVATVLGPGECLDQALATITKRHHPDLIGILTTGVTELCGEDITPLFPGTVEAPGGPLVVAVSTPDFAGGLSDGWSAAVTALVNASATVAGEGAAEQVDLAVLPGVSLTAADLDELSDLCRGFGLRTVMVPDLSQSVDGHLADDWSSLTTGGATRRDLARLTRAGVVRGVGASSESAALALGSANEADVRTFGHCCGLAATDALVRDLASVSGREPDPRVRHWRRRMADGLLDSHFVLGGARIAIALEPEHLAGVATVLAEAGAEIVAAVSPTDSPVLAEVPCPDVVLGDLSDLEERAKEADAQLVIASSHARNLARDLGVGYLAEGFPLYHQLGAQMRGCLGYRGGLRLLFDAANQLDAHG